jgi:branched-chain amino acid transport system permease protein
MGIVLRASGDLNLAHGDSLMLATYVALGTSHVSDIRLAAVLTDVVMGAAIGAVAFLVIYRPVAARRRSSSTGLGFLPSLGVALIVRNVAARLSPRGSAPFRALFAGGRARLFDDFRLPAAGWWLLAAALLVPAVLAVALERTPTGTRLRAVADDPVLAEATGLPVTRTLAVSYALAGAVGGLAGALFASFFGLVFVSLGWQATLKGFVAVVLGGAGWVWGALLGGLALGTIESFFAAYVSSTYKDAITFALLIAVLLLAPEGVLARDRLRRV